MRKPEVRPSNLNYQTLLISLYVGLPQSSLFLTDRRHHSLLGCGRRHIRICGIKYRISCFRKHRDDPPKNCVRYRISHYRNCGRSQWPRRCQASNFTHLSRLGIVVLISISSGVLADVCVFLTYEG